MSNVLDGFSILNKRTSDVCYGQMSNINLLLSTSGDNSVLKIADFGFARSLQPRGLAETLCGSPLYMAPEIMQLQKYDAKADLWSVGAILFQFVTGRTPFTGNNQIQLLQNIVKSTELHFPSDINDLSFECKDLCRKLLRRNPVERLTFEEFFNHPFLCANQPDELLGSKRSSRLVDGFPFSKSDHAGSMEENSQDDYLPFSLDDDSSGPEGSPSFVRRRSSMKSTCGFSPDKKVDRGTRDSTSRYSSLPDKREITTPLVDIRVQGRNILSDRSLNAGLRSANPQSVNTRPRVADSLELIDQDYVLVSGPSMDDYASSSLANASKPILSSCKSQSPTQTSVSLGAALTAPMPIIGKATSSSSRMGSLGSQSSAPGSLDMEDTLEQPSANCTARIKSLQQSASTITELVKEKITAGRQLEAFSIQLVILAIWKKALDICHTQAASALEGSPGQGSAESRRSLRKKQGSSLGKGTPLMVDSLQPVDISTQVEKEFLREVEYAEELAKVVEPGNTEMPDAIETMFQSALAFGRHGGVEELMGEMESAAGLYSKAAQLLVFLLVEAPSLILNPPFSLTNSDRYRLRSYIDILSNRQGYLRSQRLALLKSENQQSPP
ncbi:serine/threonine-protein kinase ATG1c-like isoform X2 [Cucurbita maxima]|uniref:Serine/threonine-protein kinase ATG1c-like isoform X2 n=1 Tax=Cucurbita maxima TaxID=3661 RepID=A0A6J1I7Z1_CUCMA|nr:serine/threonine-protein kinase ATG1c-like isoform X2 [Cucurbita maxima]